MFVEAVACSLEVHLPEQLAVSCKAREALGGVIGIGWLRLGEARCFRFRPSAAEGRLPHSPDRRRGKLEQSSPLVHIACLPTLPPALRCVATVRELASDDSCLFSYAPLGRPSSPTPSNGLGSRARIGPAGPEKLTVTGRARDKRRQELQYTTTGLDFRPWALASTCSVSRAWSRYDSLRGSCRQWRLPAPTPQIPTTTALRSLTRRVPTYERTHSSRSSQYGPRLYPLPASTPSRAPSPAWRAASSPARSMSLRQSCKLKVLSPILVCNMPVRRPVRYIGA